MTIEKTAAEQASQAEQKELLRKRAEAEQSKVDRVREYMAQTTGSESIHKHWLGLRYTDGMYFVAEVCEAHWLIDLVASYQPKLRGEDFQVWRLSPPPAEGEPWLFTAFHDIPGKILVRQEIEYSTFPVNLTPFEFWVENNTAMLKQER